MSWQIWLLIGSGVILVVTVVVLARLARTTAGPLPGLDQEPRTATVTSVHSADETDIVMVEYLDATGVPRTAGLADVIDVSWIDRFLGRQPVAGPRLPEAGPAGPRYLAFRK